jgi:hypothetical protein
MAFLFAVARTVRRLPAFTYAVDVTVVSHVDAAQVFETH